MKPSFDEFKNDVLVLLASARKETKGILSDNPDVLIRELTVAQAWAATLDYIWAEANYWYLISLDKALPPKDSGMTELDRNTKLNSATASERYVRDKIEDYGKALHARISLGQSALGYYKELRASKVG